MDLDSKKIVLDAIKEKCGSEYIEKYGYIELNGVKYSWIEKEEIETTDEGKYQNGGTIYAVGVYNEENGYGIKEELFYIEQDFMRSGSYYSEYYYEYDYPFIVEKREVTTYKWCVVR